MVDQLVHWVQSNLVAMPETDGHGDTCGPIVIADYLAAQGRVQLSISFIDRLREDLIYWGLMDVKGETGMTLKQIYRALTEHYGINAVKFVDYNAKLDFNQFHADLKAASVNRQFVIFETANASALPDNQRGVQYHFVMTGGIDSSKGYYTCNGDTYTALKSKTPVSPVWYGIGSIQNSIPVGYIVLPAISESAASTPVETVTEDESKESQSMQQLTALVGSLSQNVTDLQKSVADVQAWMSANREVLK